MSEDFYNTKYAITGCAKGFLWEEMQLCQDPAWSYCFDKIVPSVPFTPAGREEIVRQLWNSAN